MEQLKYCHSLTGRVIHQASNFLPAYVNFNKSAIALGTQEYDNYMLWWGIHFLWGPSGSIVTGIIVPNVHSSDEAEQQAATITQNQIQTAKKI